MEGVDYGREKDINLLDLIIVLLRHKVMIMAITVIFAILAAIISLVLPAIYEGNARIMPPQDNAGMASALLSQLSGVIGLGGGAQDQNSPELYVGILKGPTIADAIIDRFNLMPLFGAKTRVDARKALANIFTPEVDPKSGLVSIKVEGKDPQKVAEIANAIAEELSKLLKKLAVTGASKKRLFFEEQLKDAHIALSKAEDALKGFAESTGAIQLQDQAKGVLEGIAVLRAQIAAKEIELRVMKTYVTPYNRDFRRAEEELSGLREQLKKLEAKNGNENQDSLIPTKQIPAIGTEYLRKLREFKYQESLYEILAKQYEAARLEEVKDVPLIQVVDYATPPDKRVKPKRTLMVFAAILVGLLVAIFTAFFREYLERISNNPENSARLITIRELLTRGGLRSFLARPKQPVCSEERFTSSSKIVKVDLTQSTENSGACR